MEKIIDKKRSIGEAAKELGLGTHVIRFWESKFPQIKPQIGKGDRRYYFDKEMAVLVKIKSLLYDEGYSISGLQKLLKKRKESDLKEQNLEFLSASDNDTDSLEEDLEFFSLDDFIKPEVSSIKKPDADFKNSINQIITKIESNLKKLEQND